jgi:hypothetical protein
MVMTDTRMQSTTPSPPKGDVPMRDSKIYEPITQSLERIIAFMKSKAVAVVPPALVNVRELNQNERLDPNFDDTRLSSQEFLMGKDFEPGQMKNHILGLWEVQDDIRQLYRLKVG